MRMNKKKSSLALVLVMLLTVVVGVAWAAGTDYQTASSSVFDYSNTYAVGTVSTDAVTGGTINYYNAPFSHDVALAPLGANNNMGAATWADPGVNATPTFQANKLRVNAGTVTQPAITFAAAPADFEKQGAGKLIFSAANGGVAGHTTTVNGGTLEVRANTSIGSGAITNNATFIAAGAMTALPPITNSGTFIVNTAGALTGTTITNNIGATISVTAANLTGTTITNNGNINVSADRTLTATTSTLGTGSAVINGTLPLVDAATNNWNISGAASGLIDAAGDLTLGGNNNGFMGNIVPAVDGSTIKATKATALGSGLFDFTGRTGVIVSYDVTAAGTVATQFNAGADNSNVINFDTPIHALTVTGDSSTFNGTVNVNAGAVFLDGAKIGTLALRELAMNVVPNTTLNLTNGAEVYAFTSNLGAGSILRFDLTGAAPTFDAATLVAHDTSVIDINLTAVPASGYLNFFVMNMHTKPLLTISNGFIAEWDGFRIKISVDGNNPAPSPNVSPATARFDGNAAADLNFLLRGSALTAANNETLTLMIDGVALGSSNYAIDAPNLTLFASFLKTLADGNHTITLMNGTTNVGKITLTITNGGGTADSGSSSGCNTGALLPMALMLLAPLALFRKKD